MTMSAPLSSLGLSNSMRLSIARTQRELAAAQADLASGTLTDEGLALGGKTERVLSLRHESGRLQALRDANGVTSTRLDASQNALAALGKGAQEFLAQIAAARGSGASATTLVDTARAGLASFVATLNTSVDGSYLFAGINSDVKPVADYSSSPASAAKQATDNAFAATFGFAQSSPSVSTISVGAMQSFLDTRFAAGFTAVNWSGTWSTASDTPSTSRISPTATASTSISANDPGIRKLAEAYTMVADLGGERMGSGAYLALLDTALGKVTEASSGLTTAQTTLGAVQKRVADANDQMTLQTSLLDTALGDLTKVDSYETTTRIQSLTTQMETAYSLTARLQQLSLVKYL